MNPRAPQHLLAVNPTTARRCRSETERKYFRGSFQFSIVTVEKISPFWKPEIKLYFDICQRLKLRLSVEKFLLISLKQNFTPNTLGCYGLRSFVLCVERRIFSHLNWEMLVPD